MNRGALGARALNDALQVAINGESAPVVEKFGRRFAPGDKVMQIQNDYEKEVFNGDIGFVQAIDGEEDTLTMDFEAGWSFTDLGNWTSFSRPMPSRFTKVRVRSIPRWSFP
jgi:ATP-dependent exoDNAse (exonuclease V) alpha subunit